VNPDTSRKSQSRPIPSLAAPAKVFHWLNIISLVLMMTSGLQIYNANFFCGLAFSRSVFTRWLVSWGRHWHFAMWLFALNLLWYGLYVFITRRWQHRFVSSKDLKALQTSQNPKRKTYAWHRLAYTAIIPVLLLAVLSGLNVQTSSTSDCWFVWQLRHCECSL